MDKQPALIDRLIAHFDGRHGAASKFAVSTETLRLWRQNGIPLSRALDVEAATEGAIRAEEVLEEARGRG